MSLLLPSSAARKFADNRGAIAAKMVFGAVDDISAFILQDFLAAGFREVEWQYGFEAWQNTQLWQEMGSVCPVCFALDGQRFKIEWLLANMRHNAPKYTQSHVNCACRLVRMNRTDEQLDYSETVDAAPAAIPESLKESPITLDQISPEERARLGLPADDNEFTDIAWQWDATRNEFVPLETLQNEGSEAGEFVFDEATGQFVPKGGS